MSTITWTTPAGFLGTLSESISTSTQVEAASTLTITYTLLNGSLPPGLNLSSTGTIFGTAAAVLNTIATNFVIRASNGVKVADRAFSLHVEGNDSPIWSTAAGYLPVGYNGEGYAFNHAFIKISFTASSVDPTGSKLFYYIEDGDGPMPPGLELKSNGELSGIIKDELPAGSVPKLYTFKVTATDGAAVSSKREFKILVVPPSLFRADSTLISFSTGSVVYIGTETEYQGIINTATSISYLQPPQFIDENDLGTIRASNNQDIPITAYDAKPYYGPVTYSLVTATEVLQNIPADLKIESKKGYAFGYVPYQPAYTRKYEFTVRATKTDKESGSQSTSTNTFTLSVKGEIESGITWVTNSSLGSIETGMVSDLTLLAEQALSEYTVKYQLISGALPEGLTLARDGSICGKAKYGSAGTYTFTVRASDVYESSSQDKEFTLSVQENEKLHTQIYLRPFLSREKRNQYVNFLSDTFTFDPKFIYRYYDPNYGIQKDIKLVLEYGIEQTDLRQYLVALRENFYRKRFYFGNIKKAIAKNSNSNQVVYEIIYIEIVEDLVNNEGRSMKPVLYANNDIYYPMTIENMKRQLSILTKPNNIYLDIDTAHLPQYMKTAQEGSYTVPGYIGVIPICYALPGQGDRIISRIKLSQFDYKQLDFEVDRIIVEQTTDNLDAKYLLFDRQDIGDSVSVDNELYGLDWAPSPELTVRLDDNLGNPINRK